MLQSISASQSHPSNASAPEEDVRPHAFPDRKSPSPDLAVQLQFLHFSHPKEAKGASHRKSVRSHVTAYQHRVVRMAKQARVARSESEPPIPLKTKDDIPRTSFKPGIDSSSPGAILLPESGLLPRNSSSLPPTPALLPSKQMRPLDVSIYPEHWHSSVRPIMDHYINNMAVDGPETDSASRDFIRKHFLRLVFMDAGSLHAVLLLAAAHYARVYGEQSHDINLVQLRDMAIHEINQAMMSHQTSDHVIIAVAKLATYELLFGSRAIFQIHMIGLQGIVAVRGGLGALGIGGFLEQMLLWIDVNSAHIIGHSSGLYFPSSTFSSARGHPLPNRQLFIAGFS